MLTALSAQHSYHGTAKRLNTYECPDAFTPEIPGYTIKSIVGHGGSATVYLAQQHNLQRDVALKVMSPLLTSDPDICARFVREARDTASVSNHPNIVTIHDVGQQGSIYYIAMQFMQGPSLKQLIDTASLPTAPEKLVQQLAGALEYIHVKGFVHRDIKPANILFNDAAQPVLSDFGVASLSTHTSQLTRSGTITGTAKYMSPEQCRGESTLDARSDLYSLGVVFFEMLTGRPPYEANEPMALMLKHLNEPIPRLDANMSRYQPMINTLLAKQPGERFSTAGDVIQAIEQLPESQQANNSPSLCRADTSTTRLLNHEIQASTVTSVAFTLLLVMIGLVAFLYTQFHASDSTQGRNCPTLTRADTQERDTLLQLASIHTRVGRLTHPPGANAQEAYLLALNIDPCNQQARIALGNIQPDQTNQTTK